MSNSYPNQQHFGTGVISPRLQGRTQEEFYQNALAECKNWQVTPQGSLRYRGGFALLREIEDRETILVNFSRANREDVMVQVDTEKIIVLNKQGEKEDQDTSNNNLFRDPFFLAGKAYWDTSTFGLNGSGDFDDITDYVTYDVGALSSDVLVGRGVRLKAGSFSETETAATATLSQTITGLTPNETYEARLVVKGVSLDLTNKLVRFFNEVVLEAETPDDDLFVAVQRVYFNTPDNWTPAFPSIPYVDAGKLQEGDAKPFGLTFTCPAGVTQIKFKVTFRTLLYPTSLETNPYASAIFATKNYPTNFDAIDIGSLSCLKVGAVRDVAEFPSPFDTIEKLQQIQVATDTAERTLVFTCPLVEPYKLTESITGFYEVEPLLTPETLTELNWNDTFGFPRCCEFFQGRLWLASTKSQLSTIWASETGTFDKFKSDENNADDPLEFRLQTNGVINWLRGNKVLLIGTDRSEWIASSQTGVITNSDFNFTEQSRLGSVSEVPPQYVSDQICFVGLDRRRVRTINFDGDRTNTWASQEISLQAEQLFDNSIKDIAYARDPNYMLACALGSGQLAVCMHDRMQNLNAWYTFEMNGKIKQIEYSNDPAGSSLWIIVERLNQFSGEKITTIEKLESINGKLIHLDSWLQRDVKQIDENGNGGFSNAFSSGFDGRGRDVKVVENLEVFNLLTMGCVLEVPDPEDETATKFITHPDVYVSAGTCKLDYTGRVVNAFIGHRYSAKATTLPIEMGNPQGTGQGTKRHFNRIFAELVNDSAVPRLNGYRAEVETDEANQLDARIDGQIEVRNEGTLERGIITIEQELPLETEVVSVYGKATGSAT